MWLCGENTGNPKRLGFFCIYSGISEIFDGNPKRLGFSLFPLGFGEFGRGAIVGISEIFAVFHLISQHPPAAWPGSIFICLSVLGVKLGGAKGGEREEKRCSNFSKHFGQIRRTDFGGPVFDQYPEDS